MYTATQSPKADLGLLLARVFLCVDVAVINRRNPLLPEEGFATTSWLCKAVSRGRSTLGNELRIKRRGLTNNGRTEREWVHNLEWNLAIDSHPKREQVTTNE